MEYIIKTPRLGLRKWKKTDLAPFAKMNTNPKVMKFFPRVLTAKESNSIIERINAHFERHGFGLWAVELLGSV